MIKSLKFCTNYTFKLVSCTDIHTVQTPSGHQEFNTANDNQVVSVPNVVQDNNMVEISKHKGLPDYQTNNWMECLANTQYFYLYIWNTNHHSTCACPLNYKESTRIQIHVLDYQCPFHSKTE